MTSRLVARLTAPVAMLSFLLVALAGISAWYVQTQQRMMSRLLASNVTSVRSAQELEIRIRDMSAQFNRYLITSNEKYLKLIPSLKERTLEALDEAEKSATTPIELALVHKTREGYNRFSEDYDRILREREQWKYSRIFELIDTVLAKDILEPAHEYVRLNEEMLEHTSKVNEELTNTSPWG